jgi:ElaB/YqjD/DUF883 family membrane-anchored ribosome-binding protein
MATEKPSEGPRGGSRQGTRFTAQPATPQESSGLGPSTASDSRQGTRLTGQPATPQVPSGPKPSTASEPAQSGRGTVSDLTDSAQEATRQAVEGVRQTASSLASDASGRMKGLLGEKVTSGAQLLGHVATSTRRAADDLERNAPQISGLLRDASARIEHLSRDVQGRSIDELLETATGYARRQPAVLFGVAALAGFALFRVFKATPMRNDRLPQPSPHLHAGAPSITPGG